jgi:hypothetical protein
MSRHLDDSWENGPSASSKTTTEGVDDMPKRAIRNRDPVEVSREEAELARRTVAGDREAFDELFDRYFSRLSWYYRHLPKAEAQAATWEVLEQLFASLESVDDVALHAYRIARR